MVVVPQECAGLGLQFHLLRGEPELTLPAFVKHWDVGAVVTDFNPLRLPLQWTGRVKKELPPDVPFVQVPPPSLVVRLKYPRARLLIAALRSLCRSTPTTWCRAGRRRINWSTRPEPSEGRSPSSCPSSSPSFLRWTRTLTRPPGRQRQDQTRFRKKNNTRRLVSLNLPRANIRNNTRTLHLIISIIKSRS